MSKGLGKGLSALISEAQGSQTNIATDNSNILRLPVDQIVPGKFQPRTFFKQDELLELAESIQRNGIVQPIIVRKLSTGKHEIIAGERRWRASKLNAMSEVPVIVMELDDKKSLEIAIVENVQRQNLSPMEEAEGYQRLIEEFNYTQEELGEVIGKKRSTITNIVRLNNLPDEVKTLLYEEKLTSGHAKALVASKDATEIANLIIKRGLNVRQTEALVKKSANGGINVQAAAKRMKDPEVQNLEKEISKKVGYAINITNNGDSGKVVISYKTLEDLDDILRRLEKS